MVLGGGKGEKNDFFLHLKIGFELFCLTPNHLQKFVSSRKMPRIWMLTPWPKPTLMLKSTIGQHISCMVAIARKPISCTCILDTW